MKLFINKKGITLVALVITIIVMLVLASVTYKIAVSNDGTINQAKNAARLEKKTEEQERLENEIVRFLSTNLEIEEDIEVDSSGDLTTRTVLNDEGVEVEELAYHNSFVEYLVSLDEGWVVTDTSLKKSVEVSAEGIKQGKAQFTTIGNMKYRYRIVGPSKAVYRVSDELEITEIELKGKTIKLH